MDNRDQYSSGTSAEPHDMGPVSVLRTTNLVRSFGSFTAVNKLNLDVHEGEIYAFLGRNGAGKTTTIRMLMGIIDSDGGDLEFFGQKTKRPTNAHKRSIGYVSQEQYFYPWMNPTTLGEFVRGFYPTWDDREYLRLLKVMDLPPKRKISKLSGGMKVKLALALALAHRPELLLLDEPTSGLDPVARREFREMVAHQAKKYGRATFFSTHLIEEVEETADRVGIIEKGHLVYQGRIETLKQMTRTLVLPMTEGQADEELFVPPVGFSILETVHHADETRLILTAEPSAWAAWDFPAGRLLDMSLEDVFIAYVGGKTADL